MDISSKKKEVPCADKYGCEEGCVWLSMEGPTSLFFIERGSTPLLVPLRFFFRLHYELAQLAAVHKSSLSFLTSLRAHDVELLVVFLEEVVPRPFEKRLIVRSLEDWSHINVASFGIIQIIINLTLIREAALH